MGNDDIAKAERIRAVRRRLKGTPEDIVIGKSICNPRCTIRNSCEKRGILNHFCFNPRLKNEGNY